MTRGSVGSYNVRVPACLDSRSRSAYRDLMLACRKYSREISLKCQRLRILKDAQGMRARTGAT